MRTYYIPTSSLNFNNILSSESISPKAFYQKRAFGYKRWISIPENPFKNSIVLFDELRSFNRPASDQEDHPLLIEIALDDSVGATLVKVDEHVFLSDHTIYIDPYSSKLIFFSDKDRTIALSLSDSSIETKLVHLYRKKIVVITPPPSSYQEFDVLVEKQTLNASDIEKDKKINRMKGFLYGYYIGALLSASKEDVQQLNTAREIRDILVAILASFNHQATAQQKERLSFLYSSITSEYSFFSKLGGLIADKDLFERIVSLIRDEYGYISGEISVDAKLSELLNSSANHEEGNPAIEEINSRIKQIEDAIAAKVIPLSVEDKQVVVAEGTLLNINILNGFDKVLVTAWVNSVLSKEEYSGKTSTFKDLLSDDVTRKAKEVYEGEWRGSYPEITLNALRKHVRGEKFQHKWNNDIYSSISALIIRGDDWQKLLQFMQSKGMTDYRIVFSMYGTINGFANLQRDFTDVLFNCNRQYIADVYREFYRQLFNRDVVIPEKGRKDLEAPKQVQHIEDLPDFKKQPAGERATSQSEKIIQSDSRIKGFDEMMSKIVDKCKTAKNDEDLYKALFIKYGGLNAAFVDAVKTDSTFNKGNGAQKGVQKILDQLVKPAKTRNSKQNGEAVQQSSLFADAKDLEKV